MAVMNSSGSEGMAPRHSLLSVIEKHNFQPRRTLDAYVSLGSTAWNFPVSVTAADSETASSQCTNTHIDVLRLSQDFYKDLDDLMLIYAREEYEQGFIKIATLRIWK